MYRSKSEVDKHVSGLLHKVKNEHERNLRCFHIAQLYYKTQDYESTQRYVNMYLSVRDDSAAAYKLLGQALEGLGQKEKAIAAYTKSMKLDSDQSELILKMCELLCDKDVEFDPIIARYWSERASLLFPHSSPVFMLKEKLLTFDSAVSSKDLEELLHAELKAKPMDLNVRIKLLKLYAESGRIEIALNHAFEIESKQTVLNCHSWYQCIHNICKVYHRDNYAKCDWEFYIQWISTLDRLCSLGISENGSQSSDMSENVDCILSLDQAIHHGSQSISKPEILKDFLKHMSAQLTYHISLFLMKKAKKDNSLWKETKRLISPLLLFASNSPIHPDQSWMLSLKDSYKKLAQLWVYQSQCRIVQSGYLLMNLVKENNSEKMFFDKVNHFISGDWRNQIYKKVFNVDPNSSISHFIYSIDYSKVPLRIPSSNSLKPSSYVGSFENTYYGSLHHLVWLGLRTIKKLSILELKLPSFYTTSFKSLQLSIKNLDNIGVETINQLDVDSFLYATVFCTASILAEQKMNGYFTEDRPNILPADISSPLCTSEQSKWWSNLCNLVKGSSPQISCNESMSDLRFSLQRGLEVVRGEGLSPFLIVALARTFDTRSKMSSVIAESNVCTARAFHLWKIAYPILERLASNKTVLAPPKINDLFECPLFSIKEISSQEARSLFDEAKFFIGTYYMNVHKYEKAAEELKGIKTPQATFNLALVYQKWAEEQIEGLKGEEITSEIRCRHGVLATKARDYLLSTKSMIKNDPKHSLHSNVDAKLIDVEDMLTRIETENAVSEKDGNCSTDGSASYISGGSPITETLNMLTASNQRKMFHHSSTPHRSAHFQENRANRFNVSELVDLLSVQQSTSQLKMQQLLEQIRLVMDKLESISSEQRSQKGLIEGLNSRWNVFESEVKSTISDIKKDMKRPELCNMFEEDDYADEMLQQYQNYPQYFAPPQRLVQSTAPAPGAVSYVNPQYFSPRLDCSSFYNQQGALPFSEGQQLPDFLRQPKVSQPLLHSLQPTIPPQLNLANPVLPGPSRVLGSAVIPPNVMIPPTDVLPTVQPPLSVTIPTNNRFGNASSAVPHNFQIPLLPQPKLNVEERVIEEETPPLTYDPFPDYKPLIPLPDEIEVHTGEEDEEIIFEKRAKLYRFVDKIWKERGVGNLKILKNKKTGRARILMRREQVYKICANHFITQEMELQPKAYSKNAFVWTAHDFADEKVQLEQFCVKFKTKEESDKFKEVFDQMLKELVEPNDDNLLVSASTSVETSFCSTVTSGFGPSTVFSQIGNLSSMPSSIPNPFSTTTSSYVKFGTENLPAISTSLFTTTTTTSVNFSKTTASPLVATSTSNCTTPSNFQNKFSYTSTPTQSSSFNMPLFSSSPKITETSTPQNQPPKIGGFTFSLAQPKFKIPENPKAEKVEEPKEPGPLTKFTFPTNKSPSKDIFSNAFSNINTPKTNFLSYTFTGSPSNSASILSGNKSESSSQLNISSQSKSSNVADTSALSDTLCEATAKDDREADTFVPTAEFEPAIPLPSLINITTGEENEDVVFEERSKLYRFCKESKLWKERGVGLMKILKHKENGSHRLLMRREVVLKVCCNHRITNDITFEASTSSNNAVTWGALDHSEEKPINEVFSLKFKTSDQARKFLETVENIQNELYSSVESNNSVQNDSPTKPPVSDNLPSLAEILKPKPGSWECKECYTRNNADKDSCASCGVVKPGAVQTTTALSAAPTFSFGMPSTQSVENRPFNFGTSFISSPVSFKPPESTAGMGFNFSSGATPFLGDSTKPFTTLPTTTSSSSKTGFVFPSPTSLTTKAESGATFKFSLAATPTDTAISPNKSQADESGYDPEEEEDHLQFEPVVSMPEKVDIVTGEEDENVLYSHRSKLYRYDKTAKEWKERGVGDIKILKHKETGKIRFLMRREPIMKVCLNHRITDDIVLRPMDNKSWIWYALDYSDGTHTEEKFVIRFKTEDLAQEFHKEFEKIKQQINQQSSLTTLGDTKQLEKETIKESVSADNSGSDSDVELVSAAEASPELVEKALSLKLPANYYLYLDKEPCSGCCGCEPDDSDDLPPPTTDSITNEKPEPTEVKNIEDKSFHNIFGKALASELTIFSNSTSLSVPPSAATFTFAQNFTPSPLEEKVETSDTQSTRILPNPKSSVLQPNSFFFANTSSFTSLPSQTNIFSAGVSLSVPSIPNFDFGGKDNPTFASIASESQDKGTPTPAFVSKDFSTFDSLAKGQSFAPEIKPNDNFKWEGAGQALFFSSSNRLKELGDSTVKNNEDNEDETEDNDKSDNKDNDPYFEPVIPLPPVIEVKTGEEDEEKLFSERGKLYRYDTDKKEWKERGLGEMKILKHKEKNVFRVLMRREFVHKLVCNHLINKDISLKDKGETSFCWSANNFLEDNTPVVEQLCIKFKNAVIAKSFKDIVNKCIAVSNDKQQSG